MPASKKLQEAILDLYQQLERLAAQHDELTDTDVREALAETLNYFFVLGRDDARGQPMCYEMFSSEGDAAVTGTVGAFLSRAEQCLAESPLEPGQERHDALRDEQLKTSAGASYELFIGILDEPLPPEPLWAGRFEPGDYDD